MTQNPVLETIFPPPPSSSELLDVKDFDSREVSPDPPPPPEVQNTIENQNTTTRNKLPTGRQLARTPCAKEQLNVAETSLPSGNYAVPEHIETAAEGTCQSSSDQDLHQVQAHQRKVEEMKRKRQEEAELKRKKIEFENYSKEEKKKIEMEKKELEELRKRLLSKEKQLEVEKSKLKREEERVKSKSKLSEVHPINNGSSTLKILPQINSPRRNEVDYRDRSPKVGSPSPRCL